MVDLTIEFCPYSDAAYPGSRVTMLCLIFYYDEIYFDALSIASLTSLESAKSDILN